MYDYKIGEKVQGQSDYMGHLDILLEGTIVDIKIEEGTIYYIVETKSDSGNTDVRHWFTPEELQRVEQ